MKRNGLTTAIVAGICGIAGFAGLGQAVDLSPDSLGQVLVYPYYTVNQTQQTLLITEPNYIEETQWAVFVNDDSNPIKVRFLEGYDASTIVDFDLFVYEGPRPAADLPQPFVGALDLVGFDAAEEPPRLGDWFEVGDPGTKD
jgi:hypothetical protein